MNNVDAGSINFAANRLTESRKNRCPKESLAVKTSPAHLGQVVRSFVISGLRYYEILTPVQSTSGVPAVAVTQLRLEIP
jgi:hypothetical protein